MKTSYFGNLSKIHGPFLSISRFPPSWYTGPTLEMLSPSPALLKEAHKISEEEYKEKFYASVLNQMDPGEIFEAIVEAYGPDVILLCYEPLKKSDEYCHRRMVAKWFEDHLGVEVPEFIPEEKLPGLLDW